VIGTKSAPLQPLPKIATGIPGFDELSNGGLPRNRTTLIKGGPGSGKTVFALQSLVNAIRQRQDPGLFVAFEESIRQIGTNAATFDWGLPDVASSGHPCSDQGLSAGPQAATARTHNVLQRE
jgi:circadian clock protein KaiC